MKVLKGKVFIAILILLVLWVVVSLTVPQLLIHMNVTGVTEDGKIKYTVTNLSAWPSNDNAPLEPDPSNLYHLSEAGQWERVPSKYDGEYMVEAPGVVRYLPVIKWKNSTVSKAPLEQGETYRLTIFLRKGDRVIEISDQFTVE